MTITVSSPPFLYGFISGRYKVHRLARPDGVVAACGTRIDSDHRWRSFDTDPHEVWVDGWWPCGRCFPEFPGETVQAMFDAEEGNDAGYDANWEQVKACRIRRGFLSKPSFNGGAPSIRPDPCPPCYSNTAEGHPR